MQLDVLGLYAACSYALDCVEAELINLKTKHAKRVAYMSVCVAEKMGVQGVALQDLAVCALLHDNALTQYIKEELNNDLTKASITKQLPYLGIHCTLGEENVRKLPFHTDVRDVILYHHEHADGSGPFGKRWQEVPLFARIVHLCDLLDVAWRSYNTAAKPWEAVTSFLQEIEGSLVDAACIEAFRQAFNEEHFLALENAAFEKLLWTKVPRMKQDLSFDEVKALADFFAKIVDYKSPFTSTHSVGVAEKAQQLALFMGFDKETAEKMYLAGALHDIGKVAVGNEILEKPGKLTEEEYAVMKHHAAYTYYILSEIDDFEEMRDWAAFHHEHLDGSGYPFGKVAAELNTQERMMAYVDIYQALTEARPYKQGMSHEKACTILRDMVSRAWLDAELLPKVEACYEQ